MKGPLDIHQHLLAHDVNHEIVRLHRSAYRAATLAEALALPAHRCVATHPFHAATKAGDMLAIVLAPSDEAIDVDGLARRLGDALRTRLGAKVSFTPAGSTLVSSHTDYLAGHLAPLLLPADVIVLATQQLVDLATAIVYTPAGDAGTALGLRALDLLVLTRAIVLPERRAALRRPMTIDLDPARAAIQLDSPDDADARSPRRSGTARAAS